jgi:hypothetical protein
VIVLVILNFLQIINVMKISSTYIIFFFSPIIALFVALKNIYKNNYDHEIIFLFFLFLSFLYPPFGDSFYYYQLSNNLKHYNLFYYLHEFDIEFIFKSFFWFFSYLNIRIEIIRFFITLILTFNYYKLWNLLKLKKSLNYKDFTIFISLIYYFQLYSGFRFILASSFFILSFYYFFIEYKKIYFILYSIFTISIHFSFLPLIFLFYLNNTYFIKKSYFYFFILLCVFLSIFYFFKNFIFLNQFYISKLFSYYDGYWSKDFLLSKSIKFYISERLKVISLVPMYIYIFCYLKYNKQIKILFLSLFILLILIFDQFTLFTRYSIAIIPILGYFILYNYNYNNSFYNLIFLSSLITILSQIYSFKNQIIYSNIYKIIFPINFIISNKYDKNWINKNVYYNGDFKK